MFYLLGKRKILEIQQFLQVKIGSLQLS